MGGVLFAPHLLQYLAVLFSLKMFQVKEAVVERCLTNKADTEEEEGERGGERERNPQERGEWQCVEVVVVVPCALLMHGLWDCGSLSCVEEEGGNSKNSL